MKLNYRLLLMISIVKILLTVKTVYCMEKDNPEYLLEQDLLREISQESLDQRIQNFITNSTLQERQNMANAISELANDIVTDIDASQNLNWYERILIIVGLGILFYFAYKYSGDILNEVTQQFNISSLPSILNNVMRKMAAGNIQRRFLLHSLLLLYEKNNAAA